MKHNIGEIYILLGRIKEQINYLGRHLEEDVDDKIPNEESDPECVDTRFNNII